MIIILRNIAKALLYNDFNFLYRQNISDFFGGGYTFIAYEAQTLLNDKYKFCMRAWDLNAIKTEDL